MLAVLFTAEVLVMLDGIVVSVALPEIGDEVGLRGAELQWIIPAYTLPLGAFLLVGGRAADLLGRRRLRHPRRPRPHHRGHERGRGPQP